jgi:antitoxin ParD1/3/4
MSKNTSVSLGNHYARFIRDQLKSGRFGSASEVIRAGLRLLEEDEMKLAAVRAALEEGEESGYADGYSLDGVLQELKRKRR